MVRRLIIVAAMLSMAALSVPAIAGESPYNPGGSQNSPVIQSRKMCQKAVGDAQRKMVFMKEGPQKAAAAREVGLAMGAMDQGNGQECLEHVQKANALEQ